MAATRRRAYAERITGVSLAGYRVFRERVDIAFGDVTILAGPNSGGKSSAMHPLLLMKQSLDAPVAPPGFKLDGDHVFAESARDLIARGSNGVRFEIRTSRQRALEIEAAPTADGTFETIEMVARGPIGRPTRLRAGKRWQNRQLKPYRFMLGIEDLHRPGLRVPDAAAAVVRLLTAILHVPAFRIPRREHPAGQLADTLPGPFDQYVASVVLGWQDSKAEDDRVALKAVGAELLELGLTWAVKARRRTGASLELLVGRLPHAVQGGGKDFVNIADVGVGVSQVLPFLVALRLAKPGQLVYVEQPELHLHPRAQVMLAGIVARAVTSRGVRVVAETHSSLFIRGVQTSIARGDFGPRSVWVHWFQRQDDGTAKVTSIKPAADGSLGDFPQDFDDVEISALNAYADAAEEAVS